MSPPARGATQDEVQRINSRLEALRDDFSAVRAATAAEVATIREGQANDRISATEKHGQNRKDIHDLRGQMQDLGERFHVVKEELKDDIDEKVTKLGNDLKKEVKELGEQVTAQVVKTSKGEFPMKLLMAAIQAIVLGAVTALAVHFTH